MKIIVQKSNGGVVAVADCDAIYDASLYDIHSVGSWDWSLANLTGVDRTKTDWVYRFMQWDGTTLAPRGTPLAARYVAD